VHLVPLRLVWIAHHVDEHRGHDLPTHAVLIDDPAAGLRFSTILPQRVPVGVDLRLRTAIQMASLKESFGPALIAMNVWPNNVKSTMTTEPAGPIAESAGNDVTRSTCESGNTAA
jgi:hypothetical protein